MPRERPALWRCTDIKDYTAKSSDGTAQIKAFGEGAGWIERLDAYQRVFALEDDEAKAWARCKELSQELSELEEKLRKAKAGFGKLKAKNKARDLGRKSFEESEQRIDYYRRGVEQKSRLLARVSRPHREIQRQIFFYNTQLLNILVAR